MHDVPAYCSVYGTRPSFLLATASGFKPLPAHSDRYTGKAEAVVKERGKRIWEESDQANAMTRRHMIHTQLELLPTEEQFPAHGGTHKRTEGEL